MAFFTISPGGRLAKRGSLIVTIIARGRQKLAFLLPAMAPAVKGLGVHPCGTGNFSDAGGAFELMWPFKPWRVDLCKHAIS